MLLFFFFCFKQKTAYEMRISAWSSDVCSSDLGPEADTGGEQSLQPGLVGEEDEIGFDDGADQPPELVSRMSVILSARQRLRAGQTAQQQRPRPFVDDGREGPDRKSTRLNSSH